MTDSFKDMLGGIILRIIHFDTEQQHDTTADLADAVPSISTKAVVTLCTQLSFAPFPV